MGIPWRKIHRWLGLVVGLQVLAWMVSGLYFSLVPIEKVRGEHLTPDPATLAGVALADLVTPAQASVVFKAAMPNVPLESITIRRLRNKTVYLIGFDGGHRAVDARSGRLLPALDEQQAVLLAQSALQQDWPVVSVQQITEEAPGSEYRGRALPLYRVDFEHASHPRLYLDAWTGEVVARRTDTWRIFDFLWMLHVMDYETRDDFNHPLLQTAAALGLIIAVTGYVLWWLTSAFARNRRLRGRQGR